MLVCKLEVSLDFGVGDNRKTVHGTWKFSGYSWIACAMVLSTQMHHKEYLQYFQQPVSFQISWANYVVRIEVEEKSHVSNDCS